MNPIHSIKTAIQKALRCALIFVACAFAFQAHANDVAAQQLLNKFAALNQRLNQNAFMRPIVLDSLETPNRAAGEIHAVVDYPFAVVSAALNRPDHWCDVISLHINTKYCRPEVLPGGTLLKVNIGKKTPESLENAPRIEFNYQAIEQTPRYLAIALDAKTGPMGTSNYRIELEAVALPNNKSFLHLSYSYSMNFAARFAVQTYLATVGSSKLGFTQIGGTSNNQRQYITGVRALVERNTMRYYLAIDSFLASATDEPSTRLEKRLQAWFTATERYPGQLHELDRGTYLLMKRDEYQRQQTAQ